MKSIVGQRFGKQVVLKELGNNRVKIQCDCGTVKNPNKQYLLNGQSRSCGCGRYDSKFDTAAGQRFGRLVVIQLLGTNGCKREVLVRCDCDQHKVVDEPDLYRGHQQSCGCLRRELAQQKNRSHGESGTNRTYLYRAWESMFDRVRSSLRYPSYSKRGILVEPAWGNYAVFRSYIDEHLGERPPKHSLDRIDNDRGYEPGNIRWASPKQQTRNRSSNTLITVDGQTLCISEWAERTGISSAVICARRKRGWSDSDAVRTPVEKKKTTS